MLCPYSQLPTLLPDQLAMLNKVHRTLVHGVVSLVAKPVFITLKAERQREGTFKTIMAEHGPAWALTPPWPL